MVEVHRYLRLQVGGRSQDIGPRFADRQCVIVAVNMVKIINGLVGSTVNGKIITMYGCCGYGCGPDRNFFALRARSAPGQATGMSQMPLAPRGALPVARVCTNIRR